MYTNLWKCMFLLENSCLFGKLVWTMKQTFTLKYFIQSHLWLNSCKTLFLYINFVFFCFSVTSQLRSVLEATYTHSRNLASFVVSYKALCLLLRQLESKPRESHSFIAAFIAGYLVFGKYNKINEQVNIFAVYFMKTYRGKFKISNLL